MIELIAHRLRILCEAETAISLPGVRGPAIRGALIQALLHDFCAVKGGDSCGSSELSRLCPICPMLTTTEHDRQHGDQAPRPFTIEPPHGRDGMFGPGDPFEFGLTLFGDCAAILPYLTVALRHMGRDGVGDRRRAPGRFSLREIWSIEPLRGLQHRLLNAQSTTILMPDLAITHDAVLQRTDLLPRDAITLQLLTPLRLVSDGRLVHRLTFDAFAHRLLRRLDQVSIATTGHSLGLAFERLAAEASAIRVIRDNTRWVDGTSHSSRTGRSTPIGGLVGTISFAGDLTRFLPWLVWGEITHVGKDTTKGNGLYRVVSSQ